jgi:hypothetical protein
MKRAVCIFLTLVSGLFFTCHKAKRNIYDYFPKVKTNSATITPDGDVLVAGDVELNGDAVKAVGFCVDTLPEPSLARNQRVFMMPAMQSFTTLYIGIDQHLSFKGFNKKKAYYFRSWAANKYGYSYGNTIMLNGIQGTAVTPTCLVGSNSIDIGLGEGNVPVGPVTVAVSNTWRLGVNFMIHSVDPAYLGFTFSQKPKTRTYTLVNSDDAPVKLDIFSASIGTIQKEKITTRIMVNETSETTFDISICDGLWYDSDNKKHIFNVRFSASY